LSTAIAPTHRDGRAGEPDDMRSAIEAVVHDEQPGGEPGCLQPLFRETVTRQRQRRATTSAAGQATGAEAFTRPLDPLISAGMLAIAEQILASGDPAETRRWIVTALREAPRVEETACSYNRQQSSLSCPPRGNRRGVAARPYR